MAAFAKQRDYEAEFDGMQGMSHGDNVLEESDASMCDDITPKTRCAALLLYDRRGNLATEEEPDDE